MAGPPTAHRQVCRSDVGEWQSFYFRGQGNAINVRAQNLMQFLQIAEQVEDAVWESHLRANDYST
jgi:hypothetical protein